MPPHSSPSDEEDDYQSINLLESPDAQTPPAVSDTTRPTAGTTPSPATQTLHQLSQVETVDLRYDHSQLTRRQSAAPDSSAATSVGDSGSRNNHTPVTHNHPQPRRTSRKPGQANPGKPVQQFRHGLLVQTFPSLRNAALLTGLSRRFLMQQCRAGLTAVHGTTTLTANNTHTDPVHEEWRYAPETNTPTVSPLPLTVTQSTSSPDRIAALHNLAERLAPDYQLVHVTVPPPDSVTLTSTTPVVSLGLSITRSELPIALRRHGIPSATDTTNRIRGCRVDALATNSWAGRCGVRVDDWFLHVAEGSTHQAITTSPLVPLVTMASYDDFVTRAKTWGRQQNSTDGTVETLPPMELYLVRRKVTAPPATVVNLTDPSVATVNDVPHRGPLVSPNDPRNRDGLALGHPVTPAETATVRKIHVHSTPSKTTSTKRSEPKKPPVDSRNPTAQPIRTNRVQAKRTPDKSWILPNPVVFCHKCNGRSVKVHHAWCRKHAQFANSGADDILERITQGVRLGCAACWQEYQKGRILKDEPHNYECLERQKSIPSSSNDEAEPTQSLEKRPREGIAPKKHIRDQDFPLKRRKLTNTRLEQPYQRPTDVKPWLAELQDSDVGGNDSDLSAYQDPDAPRRRPNLKVAHRGVQISNTKIGKTAKSKASLVTNGKAKHGIHKLPNESQRPLKKSQSSKGKETSITSTEPKSAETAPSIVQRENSLSRNAYIVEDDFQMAQKPDSVIDDESTSAGVDWESCEDPWGPPGHTEGDVVLFAPATGLGHHETILPSKRYEAAPFSSSTRYCRTHRTPQEGFHALVLRRDPLADRPWGFECCRHEFGGACLVETVEPLSPAASAVFVGDLNKAGSGPGLLPKDLLISINGRLVGGMTEIGLDIELETSGAEMILLVSRYKFSDQLRVRIQKAERKDWDTIDISLNDDRLVDWTDIGSEEQRSGIDEVGQTELKEDSTGELTCSRHIADTQSDDGHSRLSPRCTRTISPVPPSCPTELVVEEILKELSQHEIALETRPQMGCQGLVPTLCSPTPNMASDPGRAQVSNSDSMTGTKGSLVTAEKEAAQIMAAGFAPINGESSRVHQTSLAFLANLPGDVSSTEVSTTGGVPLKSTDRLSPDEVSAHMAIKRSLSQDVNTSQFVKHSYGISPVQLHQDSWIDTRTNTNEQSQCSKQSSNEDKWEDDENAWVGCVCTKIHSKGVRVFWIQCDDCDTWYNVSDNCVGFSQQKAKQLEVWHCWACDHSNVEEKEVVPPSSSAKHVPAVSAEHHNGTPVFRRLDSSKPTKFRLPESEESPSALPAMPVTTRRRRSESQATQSSTTPSDQVFAEGAFVSVQQHAWPGVNNEAGIGQVLKRDKDEDGDVVYDIKYIVGGIKKGILAEYVRSHVF